MHLTKSIFEQGIVTVESYINGLHITQYNDALQPGLAFCGVFSSRRSMRALLSATLEAMRTIGTKKMKYYIFLLITYLGLVGCGESPTSAQLEIVNRLIQEQIDIRYEEQNWNLAKEYFLKKGQTVKEAAERNRKLYTEMHDYLIALKNKPYEEKKDWAVYMLEVQIEGAEGNLKFLGKPDKELILLIERWKKWLAILKE